MAMPNYLAISGEPGFSVGVFTPAYRSRIHYSAAGSIARDAYWAAQQGWRFVTFAIDLGRIDVARNSAIREARRLGLDLLLMVDEDTYGADKPSALQSLYETMQQTGAAVVGQLCSLRGERGVSAMPTDVVGDATVDVFDARIGTGLVLIDMRQLADLPLPWFRFVDDADGCDWTVGEDYYFCELVRRRGKRVVADARWRTGHSAIGEMWRAGGPHPVPVNHASIEERFQRNIAPALPTTRQERRLAERKARKLHG